MLNKSCIPRSLWLLFVSNYILSFYFGFIVEFFSNYIYFYSTFWWRNREELGFRVMHNVAVSSKYCWNLFLFLNYTKKGRFEVYDRILISNNWIRMMVNFFILILYSIEFTFMASIQMKDVQKIRELEKSIQTTNIFIY